MNERKNSRYTIEVSTDHQTKLAALAKNNKLSQGEVVEVLLDMVDPAVHDPAFAKRYEQKLAERAAKREANASNREAVTKFKNLSPEQQAKLLQNIE